jgi:pyridoxal biosynthesis lyase PdxS
MELTMELGLQECDGNSVVNLGAGNFLSQGGDSTAAAVVDRTDHATSTPIPIVQVTSNLGAQMSRDEHFRIAMERGMADLEAGRVQRVERSS